MRKTLFAAAALAPLWLIATQTPAVAATTISSSTSTPINTAADGDISINSGGSITPTATNTAAVTLNSNNIVNNGGTLSYKDVNNVTGILVQGGFTGTVTNSGTINVSESFTPSDTNKDGVNEAPFATTTSSGRYGIRVVGTSAFVGDIDNTGGIAVQGAGSSGISIEAPLTGNVNDSGTITVIGDPSANGLNTAGLRIIAPVSGNVLISGVISATGQSANAAAISGAVGGRLSVYTSLTTTDYGLTTRPAAGSTLQTIESTASEVNPNTGSALVVSGNVAAGVFLGAPPPDTNSTDTVTDNDGDGVVDSAEVASVVKTLGSAPALVIGGPNNINIGNFVASTAGNDNNNFSVIVEGTVQGSGVYDNVAATGLQIGGLGGATVLGANGVGGLKVSGTVEADSYGANATAVHIGSGALVPRLENIGTISATVLSPNTLTSTFPSFNAVATAVQIDPGATVATLVNGGTISASITGDAGDSIAVNGVIDKGGAISTVLNTGAITASFAPNATGASPTGKTVALDLSNNTTGVTLTQQQAQNVQVVTTTTSGVSTSVATLLPAASGTLVQSTAPITTTTTSGSTTTTLTTPASPTIVGDILLGNGSNTVNILAGTVVGALSLGSGPTASLTIDNGAAYVGALTYSGAALALNVNNGTLNNSSATTYNTSSFNVGANGVVYFGVDPANGKASQFLVSGAATIASGAKLGLTFTSNTTTQQTYTIVQASSLSVGETNAALAGPVPFMFNAALNANTATGTLTLTVSPKTAAEMGLNPSQTAALPATYQALALTPNTDVQNAILGQYTRSGFLGVYNQILPDYSGGIFQAANAASLAISRATAENNDIENPTGSRGAWAQELTVGVNQGVGKTDGFRGGGFGFVGGVETGGSGLGAFGTTLAFVSTSTGDPHLPGDNQTSLSELELGGYWQGEFNGVLADARVGAGYTWMAGRREIVQTNALDEITLDRKAKSSWNGYTISGRFGLAYNWTLSNKFLGGGWFVRPQTHFDYFRLDEGAYKENAAASIGQLALAIDSRTGQESSATASIVFGRKLGTGIVWRPQLELGVRDVFSGDAGDTTARYLSGGPSFILTPADITGTAGIARLKVKVSSEYYEVGVEAGGEILSSRYEEGDVKASFRVLF